MYFTIIKIKEGKKQINVSQCVSSVSLVQWNIQLPTQEQKKRNNGKKI